LLNFDEDKSVMNKFKSEDEVIVIAGKDKGKRGKITKVLSDGRFIVSGINMMKKHTKPNPQAGVAGGIVEKEAPIECSNVAIYNPTTNKADRIGFRFEDDGNKVRFFKSNNDVIK
jgi:large subunit ribosomal protein L24